MDKVLQDDIFKDQRSGFKLYLVEFRRQLGIKDKQQKQQSPSQKRKKKKEKSQRETESREVRHQPPSSGALMCSLNLQRLQSEGKEGEGLLTGRSGGERAAKVSGDGGGGAVARGRSSFSTTPRQSSCDSSRGNGGSVRAKHPGS